MTSQLTPEQISEPLAENLRLKAGISALAHLGIKHHDQEAMEIAAEAQSNTPTTNELINQIGRAAIRHRQADSVINDGVTMESHSLTLDEACAFLK